MDYARAGNKAINDVTLDAGLCFKKKSPAFKVDIWQTSKRNHLVINEHKVLNV